MRAMSYLVCMDSRAERTNLPDQTADPAEAALSEVVAELGRLAVRLGVAQNSVTDHDRT